PIGRIIVYWVGCSKPGDADRTGLRVTHFDPRENVYAARGAIDADPRLPCRAVIGRVSDPNIRLGRITNINRVIAAHFYGEEKMIHAASARRRKGVTCRKPEDRI